MNASNSGTMVQSARKIMFIAGEASGDGHAANLIKGIKARDPKIECFGAGGPKMEAAGMELNLNLTEHAVLGLVEVLKNYFKFRRFFYRMLDLAIERKPDVVVLVDYPGFNIRFAKALRRHSRKHNNRPRVVYYIAPQVWAWAERRVKVIARCVDILISIFPFEKEWFAKRSPGLRVEFVGHPIVEKYGTLPPRVHSLPGKPVLVLLPGSRMREVRLHWPILKRTVEVLRAKLSPEVLVVAATPALETMIRADPLDGVQIYNDISKALSKATVAVAASGTATLECAFFKVPTVVIYKVAFLTYFVGRMLIKVKYLAMPNLLADRSVFPEFIQTKAVAESISAEVMDLINNRSRRENIEDALCRVIETLGLEGGRDRAIDLIVSGQ